jgi:hypothetical protein
MGRIEASLKRVLWRSSSSPPSSLVPWRSHRQGQARAPRKSSSSFRELAGVGGSSSGGRAGAAGPSASSSVHSPRCVAPVLLVKVRRRCGRGKGMSGGGHPREEIRLQVRPASFILSTAPAHPSGRVTRVGRLRLSVSELFIGPL